MTKNLLFADWTSKNFEKQVLRLRCQIVDSEMSEVILHRFQYKNAKPGIFKSFLSPCFLKEAGNSVKRCSSHIIKMHFKAKKKKSLALSQFKTNDFYYYQVSCTSTLYTQDGNLQIVRRFHTGITKLSVQESAA